MQIGHLPRIKLLSTPTPLEPMHNLSAQLGGVELYVKRDDVMEPAFGGNKARKLEFILADAKRKGADLVITAGSHQSNHARLTAASGGKLGLKVVLALRGERPAEYRGNLLLDHLFGAEIRFIGSQRPDEAMQEIAEELRDGGHRPYVIPIGGANALGVCSYANAMLELLSQLNERGVKADYLVHASGTGATQAGLILGAKALSAGIQVLGISIDGVKGELVNGIEKLAREGSELLGVDQRIEKEDVHLFEEYAGEGYGSIPEEVKRTIEFIGKSEGLVLDPVYTGKAMWGLMDLVRTGYFPKGSTVIFLHTGGTTLPFAYAEEFQPGDIPRAQRGQLDLD